MGDKVAEEGHNGYEFTHGFTELKKSTQEFGVAFVL
jgi:hypothetical protein